VPFPPGGPTDVTARILAQRLAEHLGQSVLVDNRPGATGTIGATHVVKSPPDGYTLLALVTPTLLAPILYKNVTFDPTRDLTPVATMYDLPVTLAINPKMLPDVTDLPSLIAHAKAQKVPLTYTTAGVGSFSHLSVEMFKQMANFDMLHIPYKGSAAAVTDVLGGQVPVLFLDVSTVLPYIKAGRLRALAVASPQRTSLLPDVKTIAEQGFPDYAAVSWGGLLAPPDMPSPIVEKIATAMQTVLAELEVQEKLLGVGAIAHFEDGETLGRRLRGDYQRWGDVARAHNITFD